MAAKENLKYQVLAAQCGFAFEILFTIFWGWFGHNLPPASPNLSAPALAAHFALNHNAILLGNSMAALVAVLWIPWTAQLTVVMWRIRRLKPGFDDHPGDRRRAYSLGVDVLSRNLGNCGVSPGERSEPRPVAQRPRLYLVQYHLCRYLGAGDCRRSGGTGR